MLKRIIMSFVITFLAFITFPNNIYAEEYSDSVFFNPDQAYTYNHIWEHNINEIEQGAEIQSVEIELRVQVWYWEKE